MNINYIWVAIIVASQIRISLRHDVIQLSPSQYQRDPFATIRLLDMDLIKSKLISKGTAAAGIKR